MPACSEGIAATGLPTPWSTTSMRPSPMSCQPRPVIRTTSACSQPSSDAIHGGAIG